jgi:hypothetical protein
MCIVYIVDGECSVWCIVYDVYSVYSVPVHVHQLAASASEERQVEQLVCFGE